MVVSSEGSVFGDVWVKVGQRIPEVTTQTVEVKNIWQRHGQQLLLGVGLYCMHTGLYMGTTDISGVISIDVWKPE